MGLRPQSEPMKRLCLRLTKGTKNRFEEFQKATSPISRANYPSRARRKRFVSIRGHTARPISQSQRGSIHPTSTSGMWKLSPPPKESHCLRIHTKVGCNRSNHLRSQDPRQLNNDHSTVLGFLLEGYWKTIVSCFLRTEPLLKYQTTGLT